MKSKVMKTAWSIWKATTELTWSECLKIAWLTVKEDGNFWMKHDKVRIYFNFDRDAKIFIDLNTKEFKSFGNVYGMAKKDVEHYAWRLYKAVNFLQSSIKLGAYL